MGDEPTVQDRAVVRAAAERLVDDSGAGGDYARGVLAALDWLEGRRVHAPSSGELRRPGDVVERYRDWERRALAVEIACAEDWGQGLGREPIGASMHFHGAVWSTLRWSRDRDRGLSIDVPGLAAVR